MIRNPILDTLNEELVQIGLRLPDITAALKQPKDRRCRAQRILAKLPPFSLNCANYTTACNNNVNLLTAYVPAWRKSPWRIPCTAHNWKWWKHPIGN